MVLSILIVNWNTREDLLHCLASIYSNPPGCSFEVLVFDNASEDGSAEAVAATYPQVRLEGNPENLGFGRANNRLASSAQGQFWLLLNPDTIVHCGAADVLVNYLDSHSNVAAVGPRLLNSDGSLQPSIERLPTIYNEWWRLLHLDKLYPVSKYPQSRLTTSCPQPVEVLSGACLLLKRDVVEAEGLFDEDYFIYSEEIDLCDRLHRAGWEIHWVPDAVITHLGAQSTRQVADRMFIELYRSKVKFFRKRRSRISVWLYKLILLQAALLRYGFGKLTLILPSSRRNELTNMGRQYGLLLRQLPGL